MSVYSFRSTIVAALLNLILLIYLAAKGAFGMAAVPAALTVLAFASVIGAALLIAHLICGVVIGGRIPDDRRIGLGAILLMATAYAGFVLLMLRIAVFVGLAAEFPGFASVGAPAVMIAWAAWLMVWKVEARARDADARQARG
jgi:hypothetical protein